MTAQTDELLMHLRKAEEANSDDPLFAEVLDAAKIYRLVAERDAALAEVERLKADIQGEYLRNRYRFSRPELR